MYRVVAYLVYFIIKKNCLKKKSTTAGRVQSFMSDYLKGMSRDQREAKRNHSNGLLGIFASSFPRTAWV